MIFDHVQSICVFTLLRYLMPLESQRLVMEKYFKIIFACLMCSIALLHAKINAQNMSTKEIDVLYENTFSLLAANPDSAYYFTNQIAKQSSFSNYDYGLAKSKILSGYYFWGKRRLDTAKVILEDCLLYFENSHQNSLDHGRALLYLGMVNQSSQELVSAKTHTQNALAIFEKVDDKKYQSNALNILGGIEVGRTNYAKALDYFSKAYKNRLDNNTPEEDCLAEIANIALVYNRMGQFEKALELTSKSLRFSENKGDIAAQINKLNTLGSLYNSLSKYDSARYFYNKCQELAITEGRSFMAYLAGYNIANMYSNRGMYEQSNQLMMKLSQSDFEVMVNFEEMGIRLRAKNYLELGIYDSSIVLARSVFQSAMDKGNKQTIVLVSDILAKSFAQSKQHDSAYYYLRTQLTYQDSIVNLESQQKQSSLYAELETLEKEKEIYALKLERYRSKVGYAAFALIVIFTLSLLILVFWMYKVRQKKKQQVSEEKELELEIELAKNKKKLSNHTLSMIHKNNAFEEIELGIKEVIERKNGNDDQKLRKIMSSININKTLENDWNNFLSLFDDLHDSFFPIIENTHSDLSDYEYRLCALIKLKLANKEIATILNIEHKSVKMAKYRLKKKLNLEEQMSLSGYIAQI